MPGIARYQRKISSEEAREGYILVEKARLSFFPPVGATFELADGDSSRRARVESYHCECRGPDKPHEHYFIRCDNLARGERVTIAEPVSPGGPYTLSRGR